jgi:hypothetical protein
MKTKEEIEQLAENNADGYSTEEAHASYIAFQDGYTQCQEDNADKKYTKAQIIWVIQEAYGHGRDSEDTIEESIDYIFNSLNKQDNEKHT